MGSVEIMAVEIGDEVVDGWIIEELDYGPFIFTGLEVFTDTDILLYFLLAFIIFIAAADFSTDTVKNVLANGMPRVKYYLSKLILSCIFCFFILLLNVILSILAAVITAGIAMAVAPDSFNGEINIQFASLIKPFFAQLFMCLAVTCVGVFFVFVTKRTAAVNGAYIAFCSVPLMVMFILTQINNDLRFLFDYDVISNIRMLASIDLAETADIVRAFAIGGVYIAASTIGGIAIFKRSEVK
jgi:hypothetical protein